MTDSLPHDTLRPPSVKLSWDATAFTTTFKCYRIYRRPVRMPPSPWVKIGEIGTPTTLFTATTVEANHTKFIDYQPGWDDRDGGQWETGWEYAVTVVKTNLLESLFGTPITAVTVPVAQNAWVTSNTDPYLNTPVRIYQESLATETDYGIVENRYTGRNLTVTRTPKELPSRKLSATSWGFQPVSTDQVRNLRAAEASGRAVCLNRPLGDRIIGTLTVPSWEDVRVARTNAAFTIVETGPDVAEYNLPAGVTLNGSSQYLTTASNSALNPGTSAFSIVMAAVFPSTTAKIHYSKGNLGTSDGYGFRNSATSTFQFFVDGATTSGGPADDAWPYDGLLHVAVGVHTGTAQRLYRDGNLTPVKATAVTTGTITNSVATVAGANNGGASGFSALAPLTAYAYYPRALTDVEAQAAAYWLLGPYPGYRMPKGASQFIDLRDGRSFGLGTGASVTQVADISGNGLAASKTATPSSIGYPWALAALDQFV